jgi:hypothetical protein
MNIEANVSPVTTAVAKVDPESVPDNASHHAERCGATMDPAPAAVLFCRRTSRKSISIHGLSEGSSFLDKDRENRPLDNFPETIHFRKVSSSRKHYNRLIGSSPEFQNHDSKSDCTKASVQESIQALSHLLDLIDSNDSVGEE